MSFKTSLKGTLIAVVATAVLLSVSTVGTGSSLGRAQTLATFAFSPTHTLTLTAGFNTGLTIKIALAIGITPSNGICSPSVGGVSTCTVGCVH
ncbi:hypothetical protein HYR54_11265 [Candidatus Acetothermia bacterium]|nr:hypothetical protein [Candidatus Acetothermia bacterium]